MIIDCFSFFNEKEIFELRYRLLKDKVDLFVVTEGDHTHSGKPKEFTFRKVLDELNIDTSKIVYVPVYMPSYEEEPNAWVRERMQRDAAAKYIGENDVGIISDCDEIINPDFVDYYVSVAQGNPFNILRIPMVFLCGRADLRVHRPDGRPVPWDAPFLVMKNHLRDYTLSQIRESRALNANNIRYADIFTVDGGVVVDAGWHLSWMGDLNRLKTKEQAFLHWNEVSVVNADAEAGSIDLLGREDHIMQEYDVESLPAPFFIPHISQFLFKNKEQKTLISILEKDPFITTDKNTVCYTRHRDKWSFLQYHSYIENFYEEAFKPYRDKENTILEIGVDTGGSMALWSKYFSNSKILGIDIKTTRFLEQYKDTNYPNIRNIIVTDAYDPLLVDFLPEFDIIIDDGPHLLFYQLKGIELYLPKLKKGGLMVIEDVEDIKNVQHLLEMVPNNGMYKTHTYDLTDIDKRYDSIIFSIERIK
jgi:hypothetical protein